MCRSVPPDSPALRDPPTDPQQSLLVLGELVPTPPADAEDVFHLPVESQHRGGDSPVESRGPGAGLGDPESSV